MKKKRTMKPRTSHELPVPRVIKRRFPHVTRCLDADKGFVVDVTPADSDDGVSADFQQCALANALCRQAHADHALVSKRVIYVIKGNTAYRYATNERIRSEIKSFDRNHDFEPGTYSVPPTRPSKRLGADHTRPDPRPRHDTARRDWLPAPRVRDLNVADAGDGKKKRRRKKAA